MLVPIKRRTATPTRQREQRPPARKRQVAALVCRTGPHGKEVLLITSRDTRRWIIPKGWCHKGLSRAQSAVREAFEEAGIRGKVKRKPIGAFVYEKVIDATGRSLDCLVDVFQVTFKKQAMKWPERGQRDVRWMTPAKAARAVVEPDLRKILRSMVARRRGAHQK